jgi:hypothetical protein
VSDKLTREDIFTQQDAIDVGMQTSNVVKDDFGWEVPVDIAPLPSQGKIYDKNSPLHGREVVEIRAMTAKDENILMSQAYIKNGTVINKLLESCIIDKSIDINELLVGDRDALTIAIRITGYGSGYDMYTTCESCHQRTQYTANLSNLSIKRFGAEPVEIGKNIFQVELPKTKKTVLFKLLTVGDEKEISETAKRKEAMLGIKASNSRSTESLLNSVVSIDNISDRNKLSKFIDNMPILDARFLRKYIADISPTIDMNSMFKCPSCAQEAQVGIRLGLGFFWPDARV